jgi:glyoxylase-like metal-dependent hydrolase (beta-lactamase superfamily II)
VKIAERIHQISIPTPFYVGPINAYLIEDDPLTLIDTGLKTEEAERALRAGLAELGLACGDIGLIVVTHSHLDHYGLAATIAAEGGARVAAHPLEVFDLEERHAYSSPDDVRIQRTERFLLQSGLPEEKLDLILTRHPAFQQFRDPVGVTELVDEGDVLKLGSRELRVIHCPGHSPGMINLHDPEARILFSADNLLSHISPVPLINFPRDPSKPRGHSLADYIATIRRIKTFDIDIAFTGHGDIVHDVKGLIDSMIGHHEVRKRRVLEFLGGGPKTAFEVCCHLFPNMEPYHTYLGMSEAVGHLDLLETEGAARRIERNGTIRFVAADGHEHSR